MPATATPNPEALLENARFLHAFLECSNVIQDGVKAMMKIVFSSETDEDEKAMALHTIADCLYPNFHKGQLGMDLEESEQEASEKYGELADIVNQMEAEEEFFAGRLKEIMQSQKMSQADLASSIGVSQPAISNMLNRQCRPQKRTVARIAAALGVEPVDLWPEFP